MEFVSQAGQDKWVCDKLKNKANGYFIDIGAGDGCTINNSYYLEKELGWTGVCVEANKERFDKLVQNRKCICINKAIYKENILSEFAIGGGIYGIKEALQVPIDKYGVDFIESITMSQLMQNNNVPHIIEYISLDTEGNDFNVLLGFPFEEYEVLLWTIEHNAYLDNGFLKYKIREIMTKNGYMIVPDKSKSYDANSFEDWFINEKYAHL